jgi:CBS domain-containing protein
MNVESVLDPTLLVVSHEATMTEAAWVLRHPTVKAAVVTDDAGSVVGIVTASDLVGMVAEADSRPPVTAVMSTPVVTISPAATVTAAAEKMREEGIKYLPVVDGGTYKGLVSAMTLATHLPDHLLDTERQGELPTIEKSNGSARSASD